MPGEIVVLHVDDDPSMLDLTADFLERHGEQFTVTTATSADEGHRLVSDEAPDCVVSDYEMPGGDGLEFLQAVREAYPEMPFILFTGEGSEAVASEAVSAGVTDYIQKRPGSHQFELLANRIEKAVSRYRTERELDRQNDLFRKAQEIASIGAWAHDVGSGDLVWTDQVYEIHGVSREFEPSIERVEELYHPDDRQKLREAVDQTTTAGQPYDLEVRMTARDDGVRWIRTVADPQVEDGEVVRVRGTVHDVTDRKERERTLERRAEELEELTADLERQYQRLFEEAPVMAVVTRSESGRPVIEDCNQLFVETLGYETAAVVGEKLESFYSPASEHRLLEEGGYERALSGDFVGENRELVTADGETIETLLRAVPRQETREDEIGTLAFYIDISQRRELERENERLEEVTSIISHDVRNPLQVADFSIELAQKTCESDHLDRAADAIERSQTLIEDLLTLAREGDTVDEVLPVGLADVAESSWQTVDTGPATLETDVSQVVEADRNRLRQLFENLYQNATEHGGDGVTVRVGEMDDGFYVADTGTGIPETDREDVFEAGYSTSEDGTGFGLRIVEQVAEAHGWDVVATESERGGARFEVTGVGTTD